MTPVPAELKALIQRLTLHKVDFGATYVPDQPEHDREVVTDLDVANVVSSPMSNGWGRHRVLLDLDVPAWLIDSSTPGHSHLYVDVGCSWPDYLQFLKAAERIGLIEPGYLAASEARGYTSLRLPWVRKEAAS